MSLYRVLLATIAATAIAAPVFADDNVATSPAATTETTTIQTTSTDQQTTTETKINLNKATAKDLVKVKGINASKAKAIIAYRKKHGEFKSTDELTNVRGFKKLNADSVKEIEDQVTVE